MLKKTEETETCEKKRTLHKNRYQAIKKNGMNEQSSTVELMWNKKMYTFRFQQPFRWMLFDRKQKKTNKYNHSNQPSLCTDHV